MEYIAHKDNERVQTVKEHLYGTAELAGFLRKDLGRKNGVIVVECYMILGNIPKSFKEKFKMIQVKE